MWFTLKRCGYDPANCKNQTKDPHSALTAAICVYVYTILHVLWRSPLDQYIAQLKILWAISAVADIFCLILAFSLLFDSAPAEVFKCVYPTPCLSHDQADCQ